MRQITRSRKTIVICLVRRIYKFDSNLGRLAPHDAAETWRNAVLDQIELFRNAEGALDDESGSGF